MNDTPRNTTDPETPGAVAGGPGNGDETDPETPGEDDTVGFSEKATDPEPPGGG